MSNLAKSRRFISNQGNRSLIIFPVREGRVEFRRKSFPGSISFKGGAIFKRDHISCQRGKSRIQTKPYQAAPTRHKSRQIKGKQVKSRRIKPNQVKPSQIEPNQAKSSQTKTNQVKRSQVKSNQVKSSQIQSN